MRDFGVAARLMKDGHSDDEILDGLRTLCVMYREAGVERNKQPDYFKRTVAVVESRLFGKDGDAGFAEQADAQAPDVSRRRTPLRRSRQAMPMQAPLGNQNSH